MTSKAFKILNENGLKITQNRLNNLSVFLDSQKAFSLLDLKHIFKYQHDRSSIFRSLQTYYEKRIIEKFCNTTGTSVDTLNHNNPNCKGKSHYKCKDCETVVSLPFLQQEYLELLGKNKIESMNLVIEGTCEKCQKNEQIK